ncbi:ribonuclease P protein component [candidate division WWE3 bacterium]|jgi:ribonuclease P protein component|uniref:Ribonuclease P protein component n=1 Tax=candidate division WWE3 bacterium TaxID=2053526 RepID=A0A3A4ZCS4_UNCKA|nr:MAG: ribonuclease P protein component [candidate division WWE3 bacterium]
MLKKSNRLTSNFEFNVTKKYGKKFTGEFITVFAVVPRNYKGPLKIGIVVPNSVHNKAVKRNRPKRLIRESIRNMLKNSDIEVPENLWLVIYAKKGILEKSYAEISTDINKTLQEILVTR